MYVVAGLQDAMMATKLTTFVTSLVIAVSLNRVVAQQTQTRMLS